MVKVTKKMREAGEKAMAKAPKGVSMTKFAEICYKAMHNAHDVDPVIGVKQAIENLNEEQFIDTLLFALHSNQISSELEKLLSDKGRNEVANTLYDYSIRLALDLPEPATFP